MENKSCKFERRWYPQKKEEVDLCMTYHVGEARGPAIEPRKLYQWDPGRLPNSSSPECCLLGSRDIINSGFSQLWEVDHYV